MLKGVYTWSLNNHYIAILISLSVYQDGLCEPLAKKFVE